MAPVAAGDMASRVVPRMPRLTYRNPLPADQSSLSTVLTSSSESPSAASNEATTNQRLLTPVSTPTSSPIRPDFGSSTSPRTTATASVASNAPSSQDPKASKKKKKSNGVLSFLTLKEPSHSALEQFAQQQRKLASEKGGAGNIVLGSVSPQKLPASVPKVNSKWDGIPESIRSRERGTVSSRSMSITSQATSKLSRVPNGSVTSSSSESSSRNPPNSMASTASPSSVDLSLSQLNSQEPRRDSGPPVMSQEKSGSSMNSPSMTSLPEMTYFFPDNPNPLGVLPDATLPDKQLTNPAVAGRPPVPRPFADDEPSEPSCSGESSKPNVSINYDDLIDAEAIFRRLHKNQGPLAGQARELTVPKSHSFLLDDVEVSPPSQEEESSSDDDDYEMPSPNGTAMNPRRPMSAQPARLASNPAPLPIIVLPGSRRTLTGLPTLYEASCEMSIASSVELTKDTAELETPRQSMDAPSIAPSIATSVTPSVMSDSWYQSPRERLGLGGRIRKNDILPWEKESTVGKPKRGSRLALFMRSSS